MENTDLLKRILNHLIINYPFMPNIGLLDGKMGGVVFFATYAKRMNATHLNRLADLLFEDVYENITENTPIDFASGLCGIGWAVEYLIQNGLTEGDTDEVLEDIDNKIMEKDIRRITDFSFNTGLGGILFYVLTRLESYDRKGRKMPFDSVYLKDIYQKIANVGFGKRNENLSNMAIRYNNYMSGKADYDTKPTIPNSWMMDPPVGIGDITKVPIEIDKGLTGMALKLIP